MRSEEDITWETTPRTRWKIWYDKFGPYEQRIATVEATGFEILHLIDTADMFEIVAIEYNFSRVCQLELNYETLQPYTNMMLYCEWGQG